MRRGLRDHLGALRAPLWWAIALLVVAWPTAAGVVTAADTSLHAPIELFELGFEVLALFLPLLAVALYVVAFSSETANRWIFYVRTRMDLRRYLLVTFGANACVTFAVFFVAVAVWGVIAFAIAPAAGIVPDGSLPALSAQELDLLTREAATFSQLAAAGTWVYVVVLAAWIGLWAAVMSSLAFVVLLLTNNRLVAFVAPFVWCEVENFLLSYTGLEEFRTVSSYYPFSLTQEPILYAVVPMVVWVAVIAWLGWVLKRRNFEVAALL